MNKLFEKRINLSKCKLFGGNSTNKETSKATNSGSCSDVQYTTTDDNGSVIEICTDYICP
jgi:hypothetical protein